MSSTETSKTCRILYVQTNGLDNLERIFSSFVLAIVARAMHIDATMCFSGPGAILLKKGIAETVVSDDNQTLKEIMDRALKSGVEFKVCDDNIRLLKLKRDDLITEAETIGTNELKDLTTDADATIWC